ncbi:MAG: hypothetical protein AAF703_17215 [Cyanobacteria bacterium P01_D01_bin.105]
MHKLFKECAIGVLNERETTVVKLVGQEKNNQDSAQALHLHQGALRNHISPDFEWVRTARSHSGRTVGKRNL